MGSFTIFVLTLGILIGFALGRLGSGKREEEYYRCHNEVFVTNAINKLIDRDKERLINNVTLELPNGSTTQIDHILISEYGIIVIESKHYSGFIFASEKAKNWTQIIYKKRTRFLNPIRQNYWHVKAIAKLFDFLPSKAISSLVIFSGDGEFKTPLPVGVIQIEELKDFMSLRKEQVLSKNRVEFCYGRLQMRRMPETQETDRLHIANVSKNLYQMWGYGKH